jgi:hypothetical protein
MEFALNRTESSILMLITPTGRNIYFSRSGMEKHNLYFRIIESFKNKECPACAFLTDAIEKYYDDLVYEGVTDYGFIADFRKNKGFCNRHSHKLLSCKSSLATASLYAYVSRDVVDEQKKQEKPNHKNTGRKIWQACSFIENIEDVYASSFASFIDDADLKTAFLATSGLCYPHYLSVQRFLHGGEFSWLYNFQVEKFEEAHIALKRYLYSQNFSLGDKRPELTYDEQLIYQRALRMFSGYDGMKS